MSTVAILNIVLAVLIVAAIVSLLGWSIVADKARVAPRGRRELNAARAKPTSTGRERRGRMRGSTA